MASAMANVMQAVFAVLGPGPRAINLTCLQLIGVPID